MANLRTDYKDDVLDTSVNTIRKYNMITNADGTVSFEDVTEYAQVGDSYGSADINETNNHINELGEELKKYVSDGKTLVANAITEKRVETATDASFETMAENIGKIVLGSGNATVADVLAGKTFTNDDGVEYTGTMTNNGAVSKSITPSSSAQSYTIPAGYHNGSGKVNVSAASLVANQSVYSKNRYYFGIYTDEDTSRPSGSGSTSVSVPANSTCIVIATVSQHPEGGGAFTQNCTLTLSTLSCSGATITTLYEQVQDGMCITRIYKVVTGSTTSASITATGGGYYTKYVDLRLICLR